MVRAAAGPVLVVVAGPLRGTRLSLAAAVVLGRGAEAGLDLADSAVSRRHALVSPIGGGWQVTDLGSGNGTFLNGAALGAAMPLVDGDELRLGETRLAYRDYQNEPAGGGADPVPAPAPLPSPLKAAGARSVAPAGPAASVVKGRALRSGQTGVLAIPLASSPATVDPSAAAAADVELRLLRRRLELMGAVAEAMSRTTDIDELLGVILRLLMKALPQADRACVALLDEATGELPARAAIDRKGAATRMPLSQKLLRSAVASREALLIADTRLERGFSGRETIGRLGLRSFLCLPLVVGSEVFGVLQVDTAVEGQPFQAEDLHALAGVAPSIALALANARLHGQLLAHEIERRDLDLARRVQQQLMPQEPPAIPGYRCAFRCQPALAVGGDFFDFLPLAGTTWGVALGDVSGKGVSAALLMARVLGDLRIVAGQGKTPGDTVTRLNRMLAAATREAMFATLVYLELDPASGALALANAGHPAPFVRHRDGTVTALDLPTGLPAGVRPETSYLTHQARLDPGETLLLYTDGLTESVAPNGELFGETRLREALSAAPPDPEFIAHALLADLAAWTQGRPPADDLTFACIRRE